ncbi:flagellar motor protein MotB [Hydrogenophaga sp. PAMC20947]|uniref:flagellar motor protein MotB n=1 Tax=Hydrogenophaga sp. PAMC20947 TaxID=2565558 RepID=UPI00109E14DD|nr:flagellar motor protein MotB [Hydrogenophaga sp. PAMC20947]QCB46812.1 flagellar motor protein MotB [Hydrogenophaga sp. PAMC20947]
MADGKKLQPIIVKRVKKGGHVAHGGAWKIAYADFVTAMMAFFLLMWLLGSTSKGDLNGIASYFTAPVKISLLGGDGTGNSESILPGGGRDLSRSAGQVDGGDAERAAKLIGAQMARAELARQDAQRIDALEQKISDMIASNPALAEFGDQIKLEQTPEGLQIQLVDAQNRPMFDTGSAIVKPYMRDILREIGGALVDVENRISLAGHTDAMPYGSGDRGYSNWELSADRANASRRELVVGGLPDSKMLRVEGLASSRPMTPEDPSAPTNRRISILILTKEAERRVLSGGAPDPALDGSEMPASEASQSESGGAEPVDTPPTEGKIALPRLQIAPEVTKH